MKKNSKLVTQMSDSLGDCEEFLNRLKGLEEYDSIGGADGTEALDAEVQAEALSLDDDDERLADLTESRLRRLMGREAREQRLRFHALIDGDCPG